MPPNDQISVWLGALMVGILGFLFKHHFNKIDSSLSAKADRSEIAELRQELKESREMRERDMERMERLGNERYAELRQTIDQRITAFERHMGEQLKVILHHVEKK